MCYQNDLLKNATSEETAYIIADYPYGFKLRCQKKVWLEFKPGKGFRLVEQTSNPKKAGIIWNKPKMSTFSAIAAVLYFDTNGYVQWAQLYTRAEPEEVQAYINLYSASLSDIAKERATVYMNLLQKMNDKKALTGVAA